MALLCASLDPGEALPVEVLYQIFSLLDPDSLVRAKRTSRLWDDIVDDSHWRKLCARQTTIRPHMVVVGTIWSTLAKDGSVIWEDLFENLYAFHRKYAEPLYNVPAHRRAVSVEFRQHSVICKAVGSSSCDHNSQTVAQTLNRAPHTFWSSTGSDDPESGEYLLYEVDEAVVLTVIVKPYRAAYQFSTPTYAPRSIRVSVGLTPDSFFFVSDDLPVAHSGEDVMLSLAPTLVIGRFVRIELLGRYAKQPGDWLYYTAIESVRIYGVSAISLKGQLRSVPHILQNALVPDAKGQAYQPIQLDILRENDEKKKLVRKLLHGEEYGHLLDLLFSEQDSPIYEDFQIRSFFLTQLLEDAELYWGDKTENSEEISRIHETLVHSVLTESTKRNEEKFRVADDALRHYYGILIGNTSLILTAGESVFLCLAIFHPSFLRVLEEERVSITEELADVMSHVTDDDHFCLRIACLMYAQLHIHDKAVLSYLRRNCIEDMQSYLSGFNYGAEEYQALLRGIQAKTTDRRHLLQLALVLLSPFGDFPSLTERQVQDVLQLSVGNEPLEEAIRRDLESSGSQAGR